MDSRVIISMVLFFLVAGCSAPFIERESELQARNHMDRAIAFEKSLEYCQAIQEYTIVAESYPSTSYCQAAVWNAALLNIYPANPEIDHSAALHWLQIYLELPLSLEQEESARLYVALLLQIKDLQTELSRTIGVTKKLEAELAQARDELKKMKEVDVRMHRSKAEKQ